jgi:hypothetical protein
MKNLYRNNILSLTESKETNTKKHAEKIVTKIRVKMVPSAEKFAVLFFRNQRVNPLTPNDL